MCYNAVARKNIKIMKIGIVGASGNVGRIITEILLQNGFKNLHLMASAGSIGKIIDGFSISEFSPENDITIFATESDVSRRYTPEVLNAGGIVLDCSDAYRMDDDVPLVVPPINGHLVDGASRIISHANCIASPLSIALNPLLSIGITSVHVATYQSVSGAGKAAMDELLSDTKNVINGSQRMVPQNFKKSIAFNVIPQIGGFSAQGSTSEEKKISNETAKILNTSFPTHAMSVRVPVMRGHSMCVWVDFARPCDIEEIKQVLSCASSISICDDYMCPADIVGHDDVFVCRIHMNTSAKLCMWVCSDNLRRGAATDIAESALMLMRKTRKTA